MSLELFGAINEEMEFTVAITDGTLLGNIKHSKFNLIVANDTYSISETTETGALRGGLVS